MRTTRSQLAVPLFSVCIAGGIMILAPWIVDEFNMSSGVFLAVLSATQQMGTEAENLFSALLQIQLSISALLKIYSVMNMQTDIAERMLANRKQQERGRDVVEDTTLQGRGEPDLGEKGERHGAGGLDDSRISIAARKCGRAASSEMATPSASAEPASQRATKFEADSLLLEILSVGLQPPEESESSALNEAARWYTSPGCLPSRRAN